MDYFACLILRRTSFVDAPPGLSHKNRVRSLRLPLALRLTLGLFVSPAMSMSQTIVIAHRGNHEAAHENTLEAIRAADAVGANYVEIDVRVTRDSHHVLMHDSTVTRMTGAPGAIKELSLAEVRELKVLDRARPAIAPSRVPTFEEALDALGSRLGLYLDFKDGDPAALVERLQERDLLARTVVYLGTSEIDRWRSLDPQLRVIATPPEDCRTPDQLSAFLKHWPGIVLDGSVTFYDKPLVEAAHRLGVLVWPDIQNPAENPSQWSHALELGVDGLQTDHPRALLSFLSKQAPTIHPTAAP